MPNETFICYSRKDLDFIDKLENGLRAASIDPWIDREDIPVASRWRQEIAVAIQFCHNLLYVISPNSVKSEYCDKELDRALELNKRIIPIVCQLSPDIRPAVSELNWIFFDDFEQGLKNLLELLDSPLGVSFGDRLDCQIRISDRYGNRIFPLYRNQYRIGRNPQGSYAESGLFFLGDAKVSKTHATLLRKDGRWVILDGLAIFNERGRPIAYTPSANGVSIERLNEKGRVVSAGGVRPLQMRPLIHGEIARLSPETSFIYEEISPEHQYRRIEGDDKDTMV